MDRSNNVYVALLRSVNVGGHTVLRMADLRELFRSFGLTDVVTYIQSGNVLFSTEDADPERLARRLEAQLTSSFGRPMTGFVLSPADLKAAVAHNPFAPERWDLQGQDDELSCHLMFLSAPPDETRRMALMALQGEEYRFHIHGNVLYHAYPRQYAGNRRTIDFERVLGVTGTARTWKVVNKLLELSCRPVTPK